MDKKNIRDRFLKVDSANISDVLDNIGLRNQGLSSKYWNYTGKDNFKLAGWAYTIQGEMAPYKGDGDPKKMEACSGIDDYDVAVWGGEGHGICFFGELIAIGMQERGAVGSLVDGGIRDREWIQKINFPVFAKYRTPVQSIGRWRVTSWGGAVVMEGACGGTVVVSPGDFIFGDVDGVIIIPKNNILHVLDEVEKLTKTEIKVREDISNGLTLADALLRYGHV